MKKAVSLLELVLAIVVVSIGVVALPTISMTSNKSNAQTILSEVVTSSRTYISDVFLEPWNSRLSLGFMSESGAVMHTGILQADANDRRFNKNATQYFNRTIAINTSGAAVTPNVGNNGCFAGVGGINCEQQEVTITGAKDTKNAFSFTIPASQATILNIDENFDKASKTLTATFDAGTQNPNAYSFTVTAKGINGEPLLDDIEQIQLKGFAFNIGSEPR